MIPDLGKYAFVVLGSYGVSLLLLVGVIMLTLRQARRAKAHLDAIETRRASAMPDVAAKGAGHG